MKKLRLMFAAILVFCSVAVSAQNITVKGTVTDAATGEPVPFATIQIEGTTSGTSSDVDGAYTLSVPSNGVLLVSSIGYVTQRIEVAGKAVHNVILATDKEMLEETIVVAFGTTTKEAFTGSAAVVKSEQISKHTTTNVANALVGSVAGLQMRGGSGAPGAGSGSISIRGISSMYANTDPLVIVDGAPYTASLSNIPQSDIESVSVLKDAASAALYGARGASGVIIITTKKGQSRDAVINFDARVGFNSRAIQDAATITDPAEYYEAYYAQLFNYYTANGSDLAKANFEANNKMLTDLGYNVFTYPAGQNLIGTDGKLNPNATLGRQHVYNGTTYWVQPDDWKNLAYHNAFRHEYNLSLNAGSDKMSFYSSIGYLNEDGVIDYSGYDRLTARVRADYQAKKWLKIGANVGYVHSNTKSNPNMSTEWGSTNLMYYTTYIAPIYPVYVRVIGADGQPVIRTDEYGHDQYDYGVPATNYGLGRAFLQTGNPFGSNRYNKVSSIGDQLNGNFNVDIDFCRFLKFNATSTLNWGLTNQSNYDNPFYGPKAGVNGELTKASSTGFRQNHVQSLTYYDSFGDHNVNVMIGHEYYDTKTRYLAAKAQGGFSPEIPEINAFATKVDSNSYLSEYNTEGFFASAQYNYANKYYLSGSFRRDASSYFAKEHRWGNFWSVGGAWIINKEGFMSNASNVDLLKLKFSIGQQGKDNIGSWAYTDLYSLSKASETSMSPSFAQIGNPEITWETTTNSNVGLEFSFFGGRLAGSVDGYYKKTNNLLFWLSVPESAGSRGYYGNIGNIANYGAELVLNGTLIRTRTVDWGVSLNASHNKTKILTLPEAKIADNGGFYESGYWYKEGGELYDYMNYAYAGVDPQTGEALYYYDEDLSPLGEKVTVNNTSKAATKKSGTTNVIGKASRYEHGSILPKVFGGFSTSLTAGGFDFSVTFDYQLGGKVYDYQEARNMAPCVSASDAGATFSLKWRDAWSPTNTDSNIPRWQYGDQYAAYGSDRFLANASYLNLQSCTLGYSFNNVIKGISKLRIYAAGENLYFWSSRKGLDPRYSYSSMASTNVYSPVRTISGGVQITF